MVSSTSLEPRSRIMARMRWYTSRSAPRKPYIDCCASPTVASVVSPSSHNLAHDANLQVISILKLIDHDGIEAVAI